MSVAEPLFAAAARSGALRAGTENVAGIAGFGAAARAAVAEMADEAARLARLRDGLAAAYRARRARRRHFRRRRSTRLPNTLMFAVPGVGAETLVIALDLAGIAVSSGAACSSGKVARSHVLDAMRIEAELWPRARSG